MFPAGFHASASSMLRPLLKHRVPPSILALTRDLGRLPFTSAVFPLPPLLSLRFSPTGTPLDACRGDPPGVSSFVRRQA
eukprot:6193316-Pleurochrysis_carterae.AAC.2